MDINVILLLNLFICFVSSQPMRGVLKENPLIWKKHATNTKNLHKLRWLKTADISNIKHQSQTLSKTTENHGEYELLSFQNATGNSSKHRPRPLESTSRNYDTLKFRSLKNGTGNYDEHLLQPLKNGARKYAQNSDRTKKKNGKQYNKKSLLPSLQNAARYYRKQYQLEDGVEDRQRKWFCHGVECRCNSSSADCSQNYGKLRFVPKLPEHTIFLNFTYNNLTAITRADFFYNVSHLQTLDLGDNGLEFIHPEAFRIFRNLTRVFLDYNYKLTVHDLAPVLSIPTLRRLDLMHGGIATIPDDLFLRFPLPFMKTLYLHENKLGALNLTTFTPLRNLVRLGLAGNLINQMTSDLMPRLERLNLQHSFLKLFPETCRGDGATSLFPSLTHLFLADSQIAAITGRVCLPRLSVLELASNKISHFVPDMFGTRNFPSLTHLLLQSQFTLRKDVKANAFRNPKLQLLNLMYTDLSFNNDSVSADCFNGSSNLLDLQLSHTFFAGISLKKWQRLFKPLRNLRKLYLGSVSLKFLPKDSFKNMPSLQELHLYMNSITEVPDGVFDYLNLTKLGLEMNRISNVREATFSAETRRRLTFLDLSGNPLLCSCSLVWFQRWFVSRPVLFHGSRKDYRCANLPRTPLRSFHVPLQACLLSRDVSVFISVSVSMVLAVTVMASALFRFRWHMRLLLYEAFRGSNSELRRRRLREQRFDYDVFVSYAVQDCDWVISYLRPQLEDTWGLRLCLHQRDFVPGKNIADNIVDSVQGSKKVIMVFSPSFAVSAWCQFELNFSLRHVMEFDDALIVVRLCDVSSRVMTSTMVAVHKVNTYIQSEQGAEVEDSFWGRLRIAFDEILPPPQPPLSPPPDAGDEE